MDYHQNFGITFDLQYFGEAAHHPESNQKPRLYSAEMASSSHYDHNLSMMSSNTRHYSRSDSSPAYPLAGSSSTNRERITCPSGATSISRFGDVCERRVGPSHVYSRTMTDLCPPHTVSDTSSCCSSEGGPNYAYAAPNHNCASAYSLDVEFDRNNYDSMSDSSLKDYLACDDSVMMNRLRKSLEQKQEFMNRLPNSAVSDASKEYCSVSPTQLTSVWSSAPQSAVYGKLRPRVGSPDNDARSREMQMSSSLVPRTMNSPNNPNNASPPFQIVSIRAKQFENGPVDNKTELFRSELARLSVKHNVANVAARKRDFENRAQVEKQPVCPAKETRVTESNEGMWRKSVCFLFVIFQRQRNFSRIFLLSQLRFIAVLEIVPFQ